MAGRLSRSQAVTTMPFRGFYVRLSQAWIFFEDCIIRISSFQKMENCSHSNAGTGDHFRVVRDVLTSLDFSDLFGIALP